MATIKITGMLYSAQTTIEENGKKRRGFVLFVNNERNPQFSDYIPFEMFGAACDKLDAIECGQNIEVTADVRGRAYEKKDGSGKGYFLSLSAWGIAPAAGMPQYAAAPPKEYAGAQPIYGANTVNYPPTNAEAVARGEKTVIGQPQQGDLPF